MGKAIDGGREVEAIAKSTTRTAVRTGYLLIDTSLY